jgi:hypothetical protein
LFFSSRDERKIESARVRIAEECQRACVREICIADQVPNNVGGKKTIFWIIRGQRIRRCRPVLLILSVRLEIVFVLRSQGRQTSQSFHPNSRYKDGTTNVCTLAPLDGALSGRKRGFKSRRGRQALSATYGFPSSLYIGTKWAQFSASIRWLFIEAAVFSHRPRHFRAGTD